MNNTKTLKTEVSQSNTDKDGNTTLDVKTTTREIEIEPDYIKLYIQDMLMLLGLPKGQSDILVMLLRRLDYNLEIVLNSHIKKGIAQKLNIKTKDGKLAVNSIDKALGMFRKKGILRRVGRGVYRTNPRLFARGKWRDIKKIRMTVTYSENGKEISSESTK